MISKNNTLNLNKSNQFSHSKHKLNNSFNSSSGALLQNNNNPNASFIDIDFNILNTVDREGIKNSANKVYKVIMNKLSHHEKMKKNYTKTLT